MTDWHDIAALWRARALTRVEIARRAGVAVATLRRRAKAEGWDHAPPPGPTAEQAPHNDPIAAARELLAALTEALRQALADLRAAHHARRLAGGPDASSQISSQADSGLADLSALVKSHARALFAVIDYDAKLTRRRGAAGAPDHPDRSPGAPVLDLAAAREELRRRLVRLTAAAPPQPVDPQSESEHVEGGAVAVRAVGEGGPPA